MLTLSAVQANPSLIAADIQAPGGLGLRFRPLASTDSFLLGRYFCSLSADTISRYGPHPFDQPTADRLCAGIDFNQAVRMIAVQEAGAEDQIAAYFIFQPYIPRDEIERYACAGIHLDPREGCLIAPSVADAYQNRGIGTPLMRHVFSVARRLGFLRMLLMGGVYLSNERAVHYYRKLGFRDIGITFENPPGSGRVSYDMYVDL